MALTVIKAIEYANERGVAIANCSWTIPSYSQFLFDAMNQSDMLFVCAAGNDGSDFAQSKSYPAAYMLDNVISVAAMSSNGAIASFSNYGVGVDIAAPGENIYSTLPNNQYGYMDGTSMAAPYVSGVAALLKSISPESLASDIKDRILQMATPNSVLVGKVDTGAYLNASGTIMTAIEPENMLTPRYGAEYITADGALYAVGGYDGNAYLNTISKFNPGDNMWQDIAELPYATAEMSLVSYGNNLYIFGGRNTGLLNTVSIFNIKTNTITTGTSMPNALYAAAFTVHEDRAYLFGGLTASGYSNKVYAYDLLNGTWEAQVDLPFSFAYGQAQTVNHSIYILGGANDNGCLDGVYEYLPTNGAVFKTRIQYPRKDFGTVVLDDMIYLFGGSASFDEQGQNILLGDGTDNGILIEPIVDSVERFRVDEAVCEEIDTLKKAGSGLRSIAYYGNIYLMGGWNGHYQSSVTKYLGAAYPKNIQAVTAADLASIQVKWSKVNGATGYEVEIDGTIFATTSNEYIYSLSQSDSPYNLPIRVRAITENKASLWSELLNFIPNGSILDARQLSYDFTLSDKLYRTGQSKWYKVPSEQTGIVHFTLSNVPESCNYIMQLYNSSGELIAADAAEISDFVVTEYNYYITVSSIEGGSETDEYTLSGQFTVAAGSTVPDRIRAAFLQPSSLDNNIESGAPTGQDISEYAGDDIPNDPTPADVAQITPQDSQSFAMGSEPMPEEEFDETVSANLAVSPASLLQSNSETDSISYQGGTASKSVTVPAYTPSSTAQKLKLVVRIVPQNENDVFSAEWTGSNTNYSNFWYHWQGTPKHYYLTALLSRSTSSRTFNYRIVLDTKASDSTGVYTVYTYMIADSASNEDFNYTSGNDSTSTADTLSVSVNTPKTVYGKLDHPQDWDFYKVSVSANQKLSAYLTYPDGTCYNVNILDHTGNSSTLSSSQYMDGWYRADEQNSWAAIHTGSSSRNYLIVVKSDNESFSADSSYSLTVCRYNISDLGALEVNNKFSDADEKKSTFTNNYLGTVTKTATPIPFSIDSPMDADCYAVQMNAGDKLSVHMELPLAYNDNIYQYRIAICGDVYQSSASIEWQERTYNNPNSTRSKSATFIAETTGTYYVSIRSLTKRYQYNMMGSLLITKVPASYLDANENKGYECSNDYIFTTIMSLFGIRLGVNGWTKVTNSITASLDNELDVDWYRYENGAASKNAYISLSGGAAATAGALIVLDASYNLLSDGSAGLTYSFSPYAVYYIGVYVKDGQYNSVKNNRNYTLSISELPKFSGSVTSLQYNDGQEPKLGINNKATFSFNATGAANQTYTAKLYMGWDNGTLFEKASRSIRLNNGANSIVFNGVAITEPSGVRLKTQLRLYLGEALLYPTNLNDGIQSHTMTGVMPAELSLQKKPGGSMLYVNNPETITDADVIQAETYSHPKNQLIYQQSDITGVNTLYITHSTKNTSEKPTQAFYYDIDLYNPFGTDVYVSLNKPYERAASGWDGYVDLKDLYMERLWGDHERITITIPAYSHRLLFRDIMPNEFDEARDYIVQPYLCYIAIFLDFKVEPGKELTVSTLAAYETDYLNISNEGQAQYAGTGNNCTPLSGSPFIVERAAEDDVHTKMKGMDTGAQDVVTADLSYILDDTIADGELAVRIKDDFYGADFKNRQTRWIANLNPINDAYTSRYNSAPSCLPSYEYDTGDGGVYRFDFKYLIPTASYNAAYAVPLTGNERNYPLNNTVLQYFIDAAHNQRSDPLPSGVTQDVLNELAMSCGSWGVTYAYTLDITNNGAKDRTLNYHLIMKNFAAVLCVIRDAETGHTLSFEGFTPESEDARTDNDVFQITIPAGAHYKITISNLNGVGTAGFENYFVLGTAN